MKVRRYGSNVKECKRNGRAGPSSHKNVWRKL
nr:MAG TPA: hypothetical protein [Caudoviricetes sp.]DAZ17302.1 MAG TPA: hypothetical protein [Caudoviricetes sp.]